MKFKSILALIAALPLLMASCNSDSSDHSTSNLTVPTYNLFTPIDGQGDVVVRLSNYNVTVQSPDYTAQLSASSLALPGAGTASFTTKAMPLTVSSVDVDNIYRQILTFSAADASETGSKVTGLSGKLTQAFYSPDLSVTQFSPWFIPDNYLSFLVMQYTLDNTWLVRTFWPDVLFRGSTMISGNGSPTQNNEIEIRVNIDLTKPVNGKYVAEVMLYNLPGGEDEPVAHCVLKGLEADFNMNGYIVKGTGIVPQTVIGNAAAEEDTDRKIRNFNLSVTGDLTQAAASIDFENSVHYSFNGQCMAK